MRFTKLFVLVAFLVACGPQARGGDDDDQPTVDASPDAEEITLATVTGIVYAPNQGPGQAAPGQEIPISGALVYVSITKPDPIPDGVYCEVCVPTPAGGVLTGADGSFSLSVAPISYWLVIQKGQFRIERQIGLSVGTIALPASETTLPSQWNPAAGLYMPRVAVAENTNDRIVDILAKLGFGTLSGNMYGSPTGENGTEISLLTYTGTGVGSVTHLLQNIEEMRKFHIIFFPCATTMSTMHPLLEDQLILANIRRYVSEGGKLYVTDWSGELADRAFPHQIELGDDGADSTGTYDPVTFTGTLTTAGDADGGLYSLDDGNAVDQNLNAWLGLQMGPQEGGSVGIYNPAAFRVTDLWNWIAKVNAVQIGVDAMDLPVYDTPKVWATGSKGSGLQANRPIAVTYQPTGCGKVLYTSFQTANTAHAGLYPKERLMLFLIMEIQTCSDNPIN